MKMMFESADKTNDNLLRERMELQKTVTELEYLVNKRDESIEVFKSAMDERDGKYPTNQTYTKANITQSKIPEPYKVLK